VRCAFTTYNQSNRRNNAKTECKQSQAASAEVVHSKPHTTTNRTNTKQHYNPTTYQRPTAKFHLEAYTVPLNKGGIVTTEHSRTSTQDMYVVTVASSNN